MANINLDPRLIEAAFARLEAARRLYQLRDRKEQAERDLVKAHNEMDAACESYSNVERSLARGERATRTAVAS